MREFVESAQVVTFSEICQFHLGKIAKSGNGEIHTKYDGEISLEDMERIDDVTKVVIYVQLMQ
jgi:hypothetical protein